MTDREKALVQLAFAQGLRFAVENDYDSEAIEFLAPGLESEVLTLVQPPQVLNELADHIAEVSSRWHDAWIGGLEE